MTKKYMAVEKNAHVRFPIYIPECVPTQQVCNHKKAILRVITEQIHGCGNYDKSRQMIGWNIDNLIILLFI
jgi:hypothetical protein